MQGDFDRANGPEQESNQHSPNWVTAGSGPRRPPGQRTKVLIVDDRAENLLAFQVILDGMEGIELLTAHSGVEALEQVRAHDFGVILVDVNMPGIDGFETARLIRQEEKSARTPIIFLTAAADAFHATEAYAHGAIDFIETPTVPGLLRGKVRLFADYSWMIEELNRRDRKQKSRGEAQS